MRTVAQLFKTEFRIFLVEDWATPTRTSWEAGDPELIAMMGVNKFEEDPPYVSWVFVRPSERRSGLATKMYELAAKAACMYWGEPLHSDTAFVGNGEAFWRKQVAKGRATEVPGIYPPWYTLSCPAPESLAGVEDYRWFVISAGTGLIVRGFQTEGEAREWHYAQRAQHFLASRQQLKSPGSTLDPDVERSWEGWNSK